MGRVTLIEKVSPDNIPVLSMRDGEIGVITSWGLTDYPTLHHYVYQVVQRYGNSLVFLGSSYQHSLPKFFINNRTYHGLIRLLKPGEKLEIT